MIGFMSVGHQNHVQRIAYIIGAALAAWLMTSSAGCTQRSTDESGRLTNATVLGETGTHLGQFVYPRGMDVFEYEGNHYAVIVDKTARLQMMDLASGQVVGAIKVPEWDQGMPTGLTVAPSIIDPSQPAVYVADTHEHRVLVYALPLPMDDEPGPTSPIFAFGTYGQSPGEFIYPTDIAARTNHHGAVEELYISEYGGNDRVSVFRNESTKTKPIIVWDRAIGIASETVDGSEAPDALSRPQSIVLRTNLAGESELVLTDSSHHRIGRFTLDGELISWIGPVLDQDSEPMRFPYGVTILDDSTALITEFGGCVVRRINLETAEQLDSFGTPGRGDGELATPWSCSVINGRVVILDSGNNRLQMFRAAGINAEQQLAIGGHP